jgi:hypothetical protein
MPQIASAHNQIRRPRTWPATAAIAASLMLGAVGPASAAPSRDLRSPDARDTAGAIVQSPTVDLRSPDARDTAGAIVQSPTVDVRSSDARVAQGPVVDLRSPDARDGRFVQSSARQTSHVSNSFDLTYLAIGILMSLLIVAGMVLTQRRRRHGLVIGG